jgi:hypothetical protein
MRGLQCAEQPTGAGQQLLMFAVLAMQDCRSLQGGLQDPQQQQQAGRQANKQG